MEEEQQRLTNNERAARYRARKRGEDVPERSPGRPGYKQTPAHMAARGLFRRGEESPGWKGDAATDKAAHNRASQLYPLTVCQECGVTAHLDRHHIDGNPWNNGSDNIAILCRRCHMEADGRLTRLIARNGGWR